MEQLKVAYLLGSLNRGGTETLLLDVFKSWQKASYSFVGIHRKGGAYEEEFYAAGPKMYRLAPKRFRWGEYLRQLRQLLAYERVTVVHTQMALDCIYARLATMRSGIKVVTTFHGFDIGTGLLKRLQNRIAIRMADVVCFVSQYEMAYYQQHYPIGNKGRVVYNGVNFEKIDSAIPSLDFYHAKRVRLAMVGNFVSGRSQNIIVKSIHILKKRGIADFDFYFIGRRVENVPKLYDDCVRVCKENNLENVHFIGGRGDVPSILKAMDGFVYSTVHDTFGIAVIEAIAVGLPVVVNDWQVMKELYKNGGKSVLFFRSNDIEDCADKMQILLQLLQKQNNEFKKVCSEYAVEIRDTYSIGRHINHLYEVYNGL